MKFLLLAFALIASPFSSRAGEMSRGVFEEINFARTQPRAYADVIARDAGDSRGAREAIHFLRKARALPPLEFSGALAQAALSHVEDQGAGGGFGHAGRDGANPFRRMARFGEWLGAAGENIDYGGGSARTVVARLIIDAGVPGKKHRANIFRRDFRVAGIAAGPHARYGAMCVMDFAGAFVERGGRFAAQ